MADLKPCPFCGGKVDFNHNIAGVPDGIRCMGCRTILRYLRIKHQNSKPFGIVMDEMAEAWNRRAEDGQGNL